HRSVAYFRLASRQPWANPTDSAATAIRPSSRIWRNCAYPSPASPRRFSSGTRQSLNESSWVSLARQPTLRYDGPTSNPGVPEGTTIEEICLRSGVSWPVTAVMVTSPVMSVPEFVMKAFEPLITHWPSSSLAVVLVEPPSEPPP